MATDPNATPFTWSFLSDVGRWSTGVAAVAIVIGTLLTRQWAFAVSCAVGSALDILLFWLLVRRGRAMSDSPAMDAGGLGALFGIRFAAKGVLLTIAFLIPAPGFFAGAVVGVLVVEFTMMTVGAVVAARSTMRGTAGGPA